MVEQSSTVPHSQLHKPYLDLIDPQPSVLSRSALHQLRHCETRPGVLWGGLLMTTGDVSRAARVSVSCQEDIVTRRAG